MYIYTRRSSLGALKRHGLINSVAERERAFIIAEANSADDGISPRDTRARGGLIVGKTVAGGRVEIRLVLEHNVDVDGKVCID